MNSVICKVVLHLAWIAALVDIKWFKIEKKKNEEAYYIRMGRLSNYFIAFQVVLETISNKFISLIELFYDYLEGLKMIQS